MRSNRSPDSEKVNTTKNSSKNLENIHHTAVAVNLSNDIDDSDDGSIKSNLSVLRSNTCNGSRVINLAFALAIVAGTAYGIYAFLGNKGIAPKSPNIFRNPSDQGLREILISELALHNTASNCWLAIYGNVYDLSKYSKQHPGGSSAITSLAGMEATQQYSAHHNERLLQTISSTLIGKLVDTLSSSTATPSSVTAKNQVTVEELVLHNTASNCWIAIYGNVYDLTKYSNQHPGGSSVITILAGMKLLSNLAFSTMRSYCKQFKAL